MICRDETGADEENVSNVNISALSRWPDINSLSFAASLEFCKGDGIVVVGI